MNKIKLYTLTILAGFTFSNASAQTPVELDINHMIGGMPFAFNAGVKNDLGNNFNVSRLEYYISKISIKHDGGTVTPITDHYILANAQNDIKEDLGSHMITNIESVSFYIGVDTPVNHADPSLHPSGHPLEPKEPSMHWGWAGGYRFVALEGKCGANLDQELGIHALGDKNYMEVTVPVTGVMQGGKLIIPLKAEYTFALKGIDVSSGLIEHSEDAAAAQLLGNFNTSVFAAWYPVGISNVNAAAVNVGIYPNPSNGSATINFDNNIGNADVQVYDMQGRLILFHHKAASQSDVLINVEAKGLYIVKVLTENHGTIVKKLEVL